MLTAYRHPIKTLVEITFTSDRFRRFNSTSCSKDRQHQIIPRADSVRDVKVTLLTEYRSWIECFRTLYLVILSWCDLLRSALSPTTCASSTIAVWSLIRITSGFETLLGVLNIGSPLVLRPSSMCLHTYSMQAPCRLIWGACVRWQICRTWRRVSASR